jgi:dTDP-4-amino-4,6-dideoxygalactose transaminase
VWARVRLDVGWSDLAAALCACAFARDRDAGTRALEALWSPEGDALACFSVRSGFDLLLSALALPPGSEVLFSALNVRGMIAIAQRHGVVPVPVDLEPAALAPSPEALERAISPASRVLVVAHLFGARFDLGPVLAVARRRGLLVVEDCAQAFAGPAYTGHPEADVSLFSFGPLKTATALGGALVRVRDPVLFAHMRRLQAAWPLYPRRAYAGRVAKFAGLKLLTTRPVFGLVAKAFRRLGRDYEDPISDAVRGVAPLEGERALRFQPPAPMLALLRRRLLRHDAARAAARVRAARALHARLEGRLACPAAGEAQHAFWVFPILVDEPRAVMERMRRAGFDVADLRRSAAVDPPAGRPELEPAVARRALARLLVLPCYPAMPPSELAREAELLLSGLGPEAAGTAAAGSAPAAAAAGSASP